MCPQSHIITTTMVSYSLTMAVHVDTSSTELEFCAGYQEGMHNDIIELQTGMSQDIYKPHN